MSLPLQTAPLLPPLQDFPSCLPQPLIHLLAIHVEGTGSDFPQWPTVSVEFLHATYDTTLGHLTQIDRRIFSITTQWWQICSRCYREHWSQPIKWEKFISLQREAKSYQETAISVTAYVTGLLERHPKITILSRNVVFDTTRLDELLRVGGRDPIAHRPDGSYLPPVDLDSMARALAIAKKSQNAWTRDISNGLSDYENDPPLQICHRFVHYNQELHKLRVQYGKPILAVDVKAGGWKRDYPPVSVGFCFALYDLATKTFSYYSAQRFDFKVDEKELDPKCVKSCWQYRTEAFKSFQESAKPYAETARAIVSFLQPILNQYPEMTIVSDNISFDITWLNSILASQNQPSILNRADGVYQTAVDLTELQRALAIVKSTEPLFAHDVDSDRLFTTLGPQARAPVMHDHTPERAAFIAAWRYVKLMEELDKFRPAIVNYSLS